MDEEENQDVPDSEANPADGAGRPREFSMLFPRQYHWHLLYLLVSAAKLLCTLCSSFRWLSGTLTVGSGACFQELDVLVFLHAKSCEAERPKCGWKVAGCGRAQGWGTGLGEDAGTQTMQSPKEMCASFLSGVLQLFAK